MGWVGLSRVGFGKFGSVRFGSVRLAGVYGMIYADTHTQRRCLRRTSADDKRATVQRRRTLLPASPVCTECFSSGFWRPRYTPTHVWGLPFRKVFCRGLGKESATVQYRSAVVRGKLVWWFRLDIPGMHVCLDVCEYTHSCNSGAWWRFWSSWALHSLMYKYAFVCVCTRTRTHRERERGGVEREGGRGEEVKR